MNFATSLMRNIQETVTGLTSINKNSNQYRTAISSALTSVAGSHPEYSGTGFDEQFMNNQASGLMESFLNGGPLPTANELAKAWAAQFPFSDASAEKAIRNMTPVITDFLLVLSSEASFIPAVEQQTGTQMDASGLSTPEYNLA